MTGNPAINPLMGSSDQMQGSVHGPLKGGPQKLKKAMTGEKSGGMEKSGKNGTKPIDEVWNKIDQLNQLLVSAIDSAKNIGEALGKTL